MPEKELDYESDLRIDPEALDVEWMDQPRLFIHYAEAAAKAKRDMDRAKEKVDVLKAELESEIRRNPENFIIAAKVTEGVISSALLMACQGQLAVSPSCKTKTQIENCINHYTEAVAAYNETRFDTDIAQAAVRAFDMRKSALENLVKLQGQSYFAAPLEPRNLPEEYSKKQLNEERGLDKTRSSNRRKPRE